MEHYRDEKGNLFWVQTVPGDGDCLFGALACQLYALAPKHHLFKEASNHLRQMAVAEIERNYWLYQANIERFAEDLIEGDEPLGLKAARYLEYLRCPGFWGGTECLSALVNRIGFTLLIHQHNSCIRYEPQHPTVGQATYQVLFRENHYDSIICVRPTSFKLAVPDFARDVPVYLQESSFKAQVCYLSREPNSMLAAIGHQLTGTQFDEDNANRLRQLLADEIEALSDSELSELGIPCSSMGALTEFTSHLRDRRIDGGEPTLVLLSSLLGITIFVHSPARQTYRLDPAYRAGVVAIHLLVDDGHEAIRYASVISLQATPSLNRPVDRPDPPVDPLPIAEVAAREVLIQTPIDFFQCTVINERVGLQNRLTQPKWLPINKKTSTLK